jgi:4-diphosphocytidyl-2-C-methyl-D-erythritol kinase
MIVFPDCKINLGLHVLQKRSDGFHDIETVFYPVALYDGVEIISNDAAETGITFQSSGLPVDVNAADNICVKAYRLLKKDHPQMGSITMHLHKVIPAGAGLGGGSADGAFTLLLLNRKFNLALSEQELIQYALQLGSDCPFFIINTPCFAKGRGEIMERISVQLGSFKTVIINPRIHIHTGWAFSRLTPIPHRTSLKGIIALPVTEWKQGLQNDFEEVVFAHYPEIETIKAQLYQAGAVYASMSGSGSTVYGLFPKDAEPVLHFPPHYFSKSI